MICNKVYNTIKTSGKFLERLRTITIFHRTFLSEAYNCQETWNKRLQTSLLQKVNPLNMYIEMDQKYNSEKHVSAIDTDIFANAINESNLIDELADILHKLRMTAGTTYTLDSTYHAVVRYCLQVYVLIFIS